MNGQYTIPQSSEFPADTPQPIEGFHKSPEIQQPSYQRYKDIQDKIEGYRQQATEATLPRSVKERIIERVTATPRSLEERLVEEESVIGGRLFTKDETIVRQRFWYHVRDWFFERVEQQAVRDVQTVMRYHIEDTTVHKLVGAREQPLDDQERERLLTAIELYDEAVSRELYDLAA